MKNNDLEEKLLNNASLDELIKMKMEQEVYEELEKSKLQPKKEMIKDIEKVPTELIFSKKAVYKMFNRINKSETYLNGVQAEALLGLQNTVRDKMNAGLMSAFSTEDAYVKFEYVEV